MSNSIEDAIKAFDGRSIAPLEAAAVTFVDSDAELLMCECATEDDHRAVAASWLVKRLAENGRAGVFDWPRLYQVLETTPAWECVLHLLQCVQYAPEPPKPEQVEPWLDHDRVLVRVWALDAFVRIAENNTALTTDAQMRVAQALESGPASLRARARALKKRLA